MTEERRILELALLGLYAERERIEREILTVNQRLEGFKSSRKQLTAVGGGFISSRKRIARRMSETQKKKISQAMKVHWGQRRRKAV